MQIHHSPESQEITRLYREFEEIYHIMALRSGFSDSAFLIFYAITELGEGCLQKDIADRYFISRQTVRKKILASLFFILLSSLSLSYRMPTSSR